MKPEKTAVEWLQEKYKEQGTIYNFQFEEAKAIEQKQRSESYSNGHANGQMDAFTTI
jgi:hypothetical protein